MLTNFISEAANEIYGPIVQSASGDNGPDASEEPAIKRNLRPQVQDVEHVDIYERARVIYFRARRPYRVRSVNIL